MGNQLNLRRRLRWFAAICLGAALAMLIIGQTVLGHRLGPLTFVLYWLSCFAFTCLAMCLAILDAAITRRRAREEQRAFLEQTFGNITPQKKTRPEQDHDCH